MTEKKAEKVKKPQVKTRQTAAKKTAAKESVESKSTCRPVYIVDGCRTPYIKARNKPGPFSASDLAVSAGRELLSKLQIDPKSLDEVILGCMIPSPEEANIARVVSLRLGCGKNVPAYTVQRNCASGMQAIDSALKDIAMGRCDLVLAGGTESMSHSPLQFDRSGVNWFAGLATAKTFGAKLKSFAAFRPSYLKPVIVLLKGLHDHVADIGMGHTAEKLAHKFEISREAMDKFALDSHKKAASAIKNGDLSDEVVPVYDSNGTCYQVDDGIRADSSMEKLAKLRPFFDRPVGLVTAGNSSQVTDGAAVLVLASEEAVKKYNLKVKAVIKDVEWAGLDPEVMGLGPVFASTPILERNNLGLNDVDYWEINEAFAAQVLGCLKAWESSDFCKNELGLKKAMGKLDLKKLNISGGAIALGHPVGSSGARIVLHLVNTLHKNKSKRGIATICIGGGQGGAMLVETV